MEGFRRAAFTVAALLALAAAPAQDIHANAGGAQDAVVASGLSVGVDASMDLAEAQPAQFAARLVRPGQKADKCSFVPSKNPLKPKRNACRFA